MSDEKRLFGEIAIEKGYLTLDQVRRALEVQREMAENGKGRRLIGVILVELGFLTAAQVADILQAADEEPSARPSSATAPRNLRRRPATGK
jgi:hypothetical protein